MFNRATLKAFSLAIVVGIGVGRLSHAEPLVSHPGTTVIPVENWNITVGRSGESWVRELLRARGQEVFDLNIAEHGIDGLVRSVGVDSRVEYRIIEVKTLQNGTDFQLKDTKAGKQLSSGWIEERLATAAQHHPDAEARKAAEEALGQFRKSAASVRPELHGISIRENRYIVTTVDPASGAFKGEAVNSRVTDMLEELAKRAKTAEVRSSAVGMLADYDQIQAAAKPRVVRGDAFGKQLSEMVGVEEKQMGNALREASEHIRIPGQSRWVKAGGKVFKFVGKAAGPAGIVIGVAVFSAEAANIEQRLERGELTREQADAEHAKLAVSTLAGYGGAWGGLAAGAAIGTFICPGPGTVIGGIVGMVGGAIGAEVVMAATGLTDALVDYLQPGVETVRRACAYVKERGIAVTVATREQIREWVGPEVYDQTVAALNTATTWVEGTTVQAASAVKDTAVVVKDKTVQAAILAEEKTVQAAIVVKDKTVQAATTVKDGTVKGTTVVCGTVSNGASWTWHKAQFGWGYLRHKSD